MNPVTLHDNTPNASPNTTTWVAMYVVYSPSTLVPLPVTANTMLPPSAVTVGNVTGLLDVMVTVIVSPTVACVVSTGLLLMIQ